MSVDVPEPIDTQLAMGLTIGIGLTPIVFVTLAIDGGLTVALVGTSMVAIGLPLFTLWVGLVMLGVERLLL